MQQLLTPEMLEKIGHLLYGSQWQADLARALNIKTRSIRYWMEGEKDIPQTLINDLIPLLEQNMYEILEMLKIIKS